MTDIERRIEELANQLAGLKNRQSQMNTEMLSAEDELKNLIAIVKNQPAAGLENIVSAAPFAAKPDATYMPQLKETTQQKTISRKPNAFRINREMEDFIGTNVISKIGILVTIIGVFIGAKYAIDNELISPTMRIVAGYVSAAILAFLAFRLKKKYEYFSSILIAGGLAVTYFITYIAFSFYGLFAMWLAFVLMVLTTTAAVVIAHWYNQKVIALIGQVAAYGIPFLLGNKNGNVFGLFAYISFINIGLLILSFKKDWKLLYHIAFFLTWIIYLSWLATAADLTTRFLGGMIFLTINFFTFYATFLSYKIIKKEQYRLSEMSILLLNALLYFFSGLYLVHESFANQRFLTWFSIANAAVHFVAGYFIYRLKIADKTVFQFVVALGLLFITIAVPIEFNKGWVTLLWTIEATALFYIAYSNKRAFYLDISLPLVIITLLSLFHDWSYSYPYLHGGYITNFSAQPFLNGNFWLSLFVCACLGYISNASQKQSFSDGKSSTLFFFATALPLAFLVVLYFSFYNEIHFAWDRIIGSSLSKNNVFINNLKSFQSLSLLMFSCVYVSVFFTINQKSIKNEKLNFLLFLSAAIINFVFLTRGLYLIGELRDNYVLKFAESSIWLLCIRYFVFISLAILWLGMWNALKTFKTHYTFKVAFSSLFNLILLSVISNEFINWMDMAGYQNQYKLGLSLICGAYALALIFSGIVQNKKHLRILAMILFGITLLKLFFYDLASLSTISKTVVLVLLGILLLFASFLYNKYKDVLSGREEVEKY